MNTYAKALHRRRIYEGQRLRQYLKRMAQARYERWAVYRLL